MDDADAERLQAQDAEVDGVSPADGAPTDQDPEPEQQCPQCPRIVPLSARYCDSCGVALPAEPILVWPARPASGPDDHTTGVPAVSLRSGKTRAVRVLLLLVGGLSLAATAATVFEISRFNIWWNAPEADEVATITALASAENVSAVALILFAITALALTVMLIIWMYAASKDVKRHGATGRKWRPAWAIGGWFVPPASFLILFILSLFIQLPTAVVVLAIPVIMISGWYIIRSVLNEIDRISQATRGEQRSGMWRYNGVLVEGRIWWISFILGGLIANAGFNAEENQLNAGSAFESSAYTLGLGLSAVGYLVTGVGSLIGSRYIAKMSARFI